MDTWRTPAATRPLRVTPEPLTPGLHSRYDADPGVLAVEQGLENGAFTPGPLSLREAGVAWFASRIRDDVGELGHASQGG
jgi:hypothetical protein